MGCYYELGGEDEDKAENLGAIFANLPLAFFIIVLLLVLQFNSVRKATIIVLSIPLGMIGVVAGLFFATLITLLFVPVLYRLFFKVPFKDYVFHREILHQNELVES